MDKIEESFPELKSESISAECEILVNNYPHDLNAKSLLTKLMCLKMCTQPILLKKIKNSFLIS